MVLSLKKTGIIIDYFSLYQETIIQVITNSEYKKECDFIIIETPVEIFEEKNKYDVALEIIKPELLDGLILIPGTTSPFTCSSKFIYKLKNRKNIPIVAISKETQDVPSVLIDNRMGMQKLMEHFIVHHGLRKFAFFMGPKQIDDYNERYNMFLQVLKQYNLSFDEKWLFHGRYNYGYNMQVIKNGFKDRQNKIDAIICVDDFFARAAIHGLNKAGITVPEQIAVSGFNNLEYNVERSVFLTTIHQPIIEIGLKAIELLVLQIKGKKVELKTVFPVQLVTRKSCGCKTDIQEQSGKESQREIRFNSIFDNIMLTKNIDTENYADSDLKKIIQTIFSSYNDINLNIQNIYDKTGISYRKIRKLIKEAYNMSLKELINKLKIEEAIQLLSKTDLNIQDISFRVGYNGYPHFYKIFKKHTGVSPTEYRENSK